MPSFDDDLAFSVLYLLRERANIGGEEDGWLLAADISQSVGLVAEIMHDELDLLEHRGRVELRRLGPPENRVMVRITPLGRALIAARNKAQRQATIPNPNGPSPKYEFEVFLSHASDDCESFVDGLVDELRLTGIKIWYDRDRMAAGDVTVQKMNEGMASSRCSVIIASPAYFDKMFTKAEANALIYLEMVDRERLIIPVLYGLSGADLVRHSPLLAPRTHIDSSEKTLAEIVTYIAHAVSSAPESLMDPGFRLIEPLDPSPFSPGGHNAPYDLLPEPRHVEGMRPWFKINWYTPGLHEEHPAIMWEIENVGKGRATDISVFMPGLRVYKLGPLDVGKQDIQKIRYDDRYAYYEFMKPPVQAITEATDIYGNVYRQYANVSSFPKWGGNDAAFVTTQLGYPYPVSQRIVEDDPADRFLRTAKIDWGFPS